MSRARGRAALHLLGSDVVGLTDDALVQDDVERGRHVRHVQVAARALREPQPKLASGMSFSSYHDRYLNLGITPLMHRCED